VTLASLLSCSLVGEGLDRMESYLGIHWDNIMLIHILHDQVTFVKSLLTILPPGFREETSLHLTCNQCMLPSLDFSSFTSSPHLNLVQ
jgi:hypothetical protein